MRLFVVFLALLAGAKLGYQEYLFRTSARDAIIGAYRERAVLACQRDAKSQSLGIAPQAWAHPLTIRLMVGKRTADAYLWQFDNPMWNARYRNPYLVLSSGPRSAAVYCEYDIVNAAASIYRM
jgi:hypothetical protein